MGPGNIGENPKCWTSINNCLVENTEILHLHTGGSQTYNTIAGIYALAGYGSGNVEINYCVVDNCSLIHQNPEGGIGPGMSSIGGIAGKGNNAESLSIKNCDLKDTFIHDYAYDSTSGSPGGILGMIYGVRKDVTISGCNVINSTIKEYGQNVGGIIGGLQEVSGKLTVEDCNVLESNVSRDIEGDYSTVYNCVGYVAGFLYGINGVEISNINILGKDLPKGAEGRMTIKSDGANIGAVIGNVQSCRDFKAHDINVKNIDIVNTVGLNGEQYLDAAQTGGFAGLLYSNKHELTNIKIDNCDVKCGKSFNVGGVAATMFGSTNLLKNIEITNTDMITELKPEDAITTYGHVGGLIGEQIYSGSTYEDCRVENCKMTCGCVGAAGIVSHSGGSVTMKDCTVKNIELIDSWENPQGEIIYIMRNKYGHEYEWVYQQFRPYGGAMGTISGELNADNVVVDGIKCHAKYAHIGGIVGYASGAKINNCTVKNADFYSERNISTENGAVGGIIADGYNVSEFTNNKVQDSTITTTTHLLGGLIGYTHNPATISDCEVNNVELTHKNKAHYYEITEDYPILRGPSMGGAIGETDATVEIKNTTVKNSTLKAENPDNISLQLGGVLGYSLKDDAVKVTLDNVNVINTTIENQTSSSATGGLIGMSWGATIKNSAVKENSKVTGKGHTAGFVGLGSLDVTDSKLLNATITSAGNETAAGIIAIGNQTDANWNYLPSDINGVEIKNTTITGSTDSSYWGNHAAGVAAVYAGKIENITMSNVDITSGGVVAGVVAIKGNDEEIKDVVLSDVNPTSTNSHAAGIVGVSNANISNAKISNSEIRANQMAGGIVATNNGSTITDVEVNNVKVTSSTNHAGGVVACTSYKIENADVKDSTITGNGHAGGIAATSNGEIKHVTVDGSTIKGSGHAGGIVACTYGVINNATVTDTSVTGNALTGGITGVSNAEINTASVTNSTVKSETMHVGGIVACTLQPVKSSSVKGSTIITLAGSYAAGDNTNPTCLGGLVGAGMKDPTTGELNPDLSTSTVENNTLTGATGTIVGKYIGAPTDLNDQMVAAEPVSNTNSLTGSQAPLNTQAAPMQTMSAPLQTTSTSTTQSATNNAEEPKVTNSDETTNSEPTTSTTNEEETSTESTEESTPSTTTTTDSETDTTSSSDKTEEASTTEGND